MTQPYGFCHCGCGERTAISDRTHKALGLVMGEPRKWLRGHHQRRLSEDYVVDANGCWIWQRGVNPNGYGRCVRGGECTTAHRWYYEREHGRLPDHLHVDHLCRKTLCVNPAHLEAVTVTENVRSSTMTKLTAEIVRTIRNSPDAPLALAERYGVTEGTIRDIRKRRSWKDIA